MGDDAERLRREVVAAALRARADQLGGYVTFAELGSFRMPDGFRDFLAG